MGRKRVNKYPIAFRQMALERMKTCASVSALAEDGGTSNRAVSLAAPAGSRTRWHAELGHTRASQRDTRSEAGAGGQDAGSGFFQRCLAKSRGSTPERQRLWRDGIYDEVREVMPMQGGLSIERLAGFLRKGAMTDGASQLRSPHTHRPTQPARGCAPKLCARYRAVSSSLRMNGELGRDSNRRLARAIPIPTSRLRAKS